MIEDQGVPPSGSGHSGDPEPQERLGHSASVPNAMVERMARAMFDCYHGYNLETRQMLWQQARYGLLRQAERALRAMREPTDEMIEAAAATAGMKAVNSAMTLHQARGYGFAEGSFTAGSPLHQAWRAMIDAASAIEAQRAIDSEAGVVADESATAQPGRPDTPDSPEIAALIVAARDVIERRSPGTQTERLERLEKALAGVSKEEGES